MNWNKTETCLPHRSMEVLGWLDDYFFVLLFNAKDKRFICQTYCHVDYTNYCYRVPKFWTPLDTPTPMHKPLKLGPKIETKGKEEIEFLSENEYLTTRDAADYLNVAISTMRKMKGIRRRKDPVSNRIIYKMSDLERIKEEK